jgi:cytochrome c556
MTRKWGLVVVTSLISLAVQAGPIEDQIRYRQSAYSFIGWNFGKIKNQVVDHPETYNKDQVVAAANALAATANSGLGALFGPGTDKGTGWKPTRLKAEFFQQPEDVRTAGVAFITEATALARAAESGNPEIIKAQFNKTSETCKGCHDKFRAKE